MKCHGSQVKFLDPRNIPVLPRRAGESQELPASPLAPCGSSSTDQPQCRGSELDSASALSHVLRRPCAPSPGCPHPSEYQFPPAAFSTLTGLSSLQQSQSQAGWVCPHGSCSKKGLGSRKQPGSAPGEGSLQSQPQLGTKSSCGQTQQQKAGGGS